MSALGGRRGETRAARVGQGAPRRAPLSVLHPPGIWEGCGARLQDAAAQIRETPQVVDKLVNGLLLSLTLVNGLV